MNLIMIKPLLTYANINSACAQSFYHLVFDASIVGSLSENKLTFGTMRTTYVDPESFFRGGRTLTTFFFCSYMCIVNKGFHIPLKVGHHRPASETPFKWRFNDGPKLNADL